MHCVVDAMIVPLLQQLVLTKSDRCLTEQLNGTTCKSYKICSTR